MRAVLIFSIISTILLSGCATQVEDLQEKSPPQETSTQGTPQETEITAVPTVETKKAPKESAMQPEPKTYNIVIAQGIGIKEISG